jgi:hypothetical protein
MKRCSIWWSAVFAMVLAVTGCGDDCVRTCEMGGFPGTSETIAVLSSLETIDCGRGGSTACLAESEAFTSCVGSL